MTTNNLGSQLKLNGVNKAKATANRKIISSAWNKLDRDIRSKTDIIPANADMVKLSTNIAELQSELDLITREYNQASGVIRRLDRERRLLIIANA